MSLREASRLFATHTGGTQSARHIKPLHWYMACRLVLEGGFEPDDITPRPPFVVSRRNVLSFDAETGGTGEEIVLGGLKTKNVDVVVTKPKIGPVLAISCKGATKAFRNLTNRMEETIGECTNLHITYPALVIGYFVALRANRSIQDALEAPALDADEEAAGNHPEPEGRTVEEAAVEQLQRNDIAIRASGEPSEEIRRFYSALSEMTGRRGIRDEISRYEAIALTMIEPKGASAGAPFQGFPLEGDLLHLSRFFPSLYEQYDERFVFGAPSLAGRTRRREWSAASPIFKNPPSDAPQLDYTPRTS
ncbi:MAG TPA: hypothetical protein VM782_18845 [Stellaceae bacterium]|nr:hypothetical protein [Stellaceae bacterium]